MCAPTLEPTVAGVISRVFPQAAVESIRAVPSIRPQRLFEVAMSNGTSMVVSLAPPLMVKLLRSEHSAVSSEAALLKWIAGSSCSVRHVAQGQCDHEGSARDDSKGVVPAKDCRPSPGEAGRLDFFPSLVFHSPPGAQYGSEYNVLRPTAGTTLDLLSPPMTPSERKSVDFQTGILLRRISRLRSPSGKFGPAIAVLSGTPTPPTWKGGPRAHDGRAVETWSTAFAALLEGVLRDGEDMAMTLAYSAVRRHFQRLRHLLDSIKTPRLVAIDAGQDHNTMVYREHPRSEPSRHYNSPQSLGKSKEQGKRVTGAAETGPGRGEEIGGSAISVTGLRDWSNCLFGDPLFATVFAAEEPPAGLLHGFDSALDDEDPVEAGRGPSLIEDRPNAHVRLLLYECYHTITRIVREFYRPRQDGGKQELEARKRLNNVLACLDGVGEPESRRRRASGETSPPKRAKSVEDREDSGV